MYQIKSVFVLLIVGLSLVIQPVSMAAVANGGYACYVQLLKAACWDDFQVSLQLIEAVTSVIQDRFSLAANVFAAKHVFVCDDYEHITFAANFSPSLWAGQENTWYQANQVWVVPDELPSSTVEWGITLCFPHDFISVPLLPSGDVLDCQCVKP